MFLLLILMAAGCREKREMPVSTPAQTVTEPVQNQSGTKPREAQSDQESMPGPVAQESMSGQSDQEPMSGQSDQEPMSRQVAQESMPGQVDQEPRSGQVVQESMSDQSDTEPQPAQSDTLAAAEPDAADGGSGAAESTEPLAAEPAAEPQAAEETTPARHFHVVVNGDSRSVCLYCSQAYSEEEFPKHLFTHHLSETYSADFGDLTFVAKGGEGYDFFSTYGLALAATHFGPDSVLVVWFGVNDAERADQYITYMNNVSLQFGIPVYYMTIGPCYDQWTIREPAVEEMNRKLKENLRPEIRVIDMFSFIQDGIARGEFGTLDGLHYNYHTCRAIVEHLLQVLEEEYAAGRMEFHYTGSLG